MSYSASLARRTNITVVDTWHFWIIHLWVEGFFEFFATTVVALTFYQLGLTPPQRGIALDLPRRDPVLPRRADGHRGGKVTPRRHR
jgi:hypothetical protein